LFHISYIFLKPGNNFQNTLSKFSRAAKFAGKRS